MFIEVSPLSNGRSQVKRTTAKCGECCLNNSRRRILASARCARVRQMNAASMLVAKTRRAMSFSSIREVALFYVLILSSIPLVTSLFSM
jgi:hypothetical protein